MDRVAGMNAFATVVISGSFSAAAQRLKMSPAMVTNHVRALEDHLGARLLNRTTRKLSLTEAGQQYYHSCTQILTQIDEADTQIAALNSVPRGTLKINIHSSLATGLSRLIGEFGAAHPDLTLELVATDRWIDPVEDGVDVMIRFGEPADSTLIIRRVGGFRLVLCAAPAYLTARGVPQRPHDLAHHDCISFMSRGFTALTREWRLFGSEGEIVVPITSSLQTNSAQLIVAATYEGRGITFWPTYSIDRDARAARLVRLLPDYHGGEFPILIAYPHRRYMPAKLRSFLDFAVRHFAEHPMWQLEQSGAPVEHAHETQRAG